MTLYEDFLHFMMTSHQITKRMENLSFEEEKAGRNLDLFSIQGTGNPGLTNVKDGSFWL